MTERRSDVVVYVDDMEAEFKPKHRPGVRYVLCHMIADSDDELHAMADAIGVSRRWFQGDHCDITKTKRIKAVQNGAKQITWREAGRIMRRRRRKVGP